MGSHELNMPDGPNATSGDTAIALAVIYEQQLPLIQGIREPKCVLGQDEWERAMSEAACNDGFPHPQVWVPGTHALVTRAFPKQDGVRMRQGWAMFNALSESPHVEMNGRQQAVLCGWKALSLPHRPC